MTQCPKCGASSAGKFCAQCGAPLPARCTSCGAVIGSGHRFCGECGAPAPSDPLPRPGQGSPAVNVGDIGVMRGTIDASTNVHNTTNIGSQTNISGPVHVHKSVERSEPNAEDHFRAGLRALQARLYHQAEQAFKQALQLRPGLTDAYYYLALVTLQGERPRLVSLAAVRSAEGFLSSATNIDSRCAHAFLLWALVKEDAYVLNGMEDRPPTVAQLLSKVGSIDRQRVHEITNLIGAPGNRVWDWAVTLTK